jgi:hypothetical protein
LLRNTLELMRNELNGFRNYKIDIKRILREYSEINKQLINVELENIIKGLDIHRILYKEEIDNRKYNIDKLSRTLEDIANR